MISLLKIIVKNKAQTTISKIVKNIVKFILFLDLLDSIIMLSK